MLASIVYATLLLDADAAVTPPHAYARYALRRCALRRVAIITMLCAITAATLRSFARRSRGAASARCCVCQHTCLRHHADAMPLPRAMMFSRRAMLRMR